MSSWQGAWPALLPVRSSVSTPALITLGSALQTTVDLEGVRASSLYPSHLRANKCWGHPTPLAHTLWPTAQVRCKAFFPGCCSHDPVVSSLDSCSGQEVRGKGITPVPRLPHGEGWQGWHSCDLVLRTGSRALAPHPYYQSQLRCPAQLRHKACS